MAVAASLFVVVPSIASASSATATMISKVNSYRAQHGLGPLRTSSSLNRSASKYAHHMMKAHYFGHAGRIQASRRFRTVGEILEMHRGYGARTSAALKAWGNSPGHRAIILDGRFKYVGAGVMHGRYQGHRMTFWVMHFGT
jgi:uncharacterized protein YkwD